MIEIDLWLWIIVTAVGLVVSIWALIESYDDYKLSRRNNLSEAAKYDTRSDLIQESLTLVLMLVATSLAITVLWPIESLRSYTTFGLVTILALVVCKQILRRIARQELLRKTGVR